MKKISFSKIVRQAFEDKDVRTLHELYLMFEDNEKLEYEPRVLKHRIRSTLYGLKKTNYIELIDVGKYKKI